MRTYILKNADGLYVTIDGLKSGQSNALRIVSDSPITVDDRGQDSPVRPVRLKARVPADVTPF